MYNLNLKFENNLYIHHILAHFIWRLNIMIQVFLINYNVLYSVRTKLQIRHVLKNNHFDKDSQVF